MRKEHIILREVKGRVERGERGEHNLDFGSPPSHPTKNLHLGGQNDNL